MGKQLSNLSAGIVHVAGDNSVFWTDDDTSGLDTNFYSMRAIIAIGSRMRVRINIERVVRAGLSASLAANTPVIVEIDNSIRSGIKRCDWTDFDTGSISAVVAAMHGEQATSMRINPFLDVLHPGTVHA